MLRRRTRRQESRRGESLRRGSSWAGARTQTQVHEACASELFTLRADELMDDDTVSRVPLISRESILIWARPLPARRKCAELPAITRTNCLLPETRRSKARVRTTDRCGPFPSILFCSLQALLPPQQAFPGISGDVSLLANSSNLQLPHASRN